METINNIELADESVYPDEDVLKKFSESHTALIADY
jgi:hypothetical protein